MDVVHPRLIDVQSLLAHSSPHPRGDDSLSLHPACAAVKTGTAPRLRPSTFELGLRALSSPCFNWVLSLEGTKGVQGQGVVSNNWIERD